MEGFQFALLYIDSMRLMKLHSRYIIQVINGLLSTDPRKTGMTKAESMLLNIVVDSV
jgi:hypothetical protein